MTKHGFTSAGKQRWRCRQCNQTGVNTINNDAKELTGFLTWLMGKCALAELRVNPRTFRRHHARFWQLWPLPPVVEDEYAYIHLDGIHLGRKAVVLIARSQTHVLGWYVARRESVASWSALISRITPPQVVICDGGSGLATAIAQCWPHTRVQRCLFHALLRVKEGTTLNPRLPAGQQLLALAYQLQHVDTPDQARQWLDLYHQWHQRWRVFLQEKTLINNRVYLTHERLVKASNSLRTLVRRQTLFTYLDPALAHLGPIPRTNNRLEGHTNAAIRRMLHHHRGMPLLHQIKAIFWYCYLNSPNPLPPAQILATMPTDTQIEHLYQQAHTTGTQPTHLVPATLVDWNELHRPRFTWT